MVDVALEHLTQLLVPGEKIEATSAQIRLFALTHRRIVIAATTNRFISLSRGLFGGYQPVDIRWQDLEEAKLSVGIFAATLNVRASGATDLAGEDHAHNVLVLTGLEKTSAQSVYRICQAQEQAWREKRRVRELEEMRARAGGIQFGAPGLMSAPPEPGQNDAVARLAQAREMLDKGLISDAEYEAMKARIISAL